MRNTCQSQLLVAVPPFCRGPFEFTKKLQSVDLAKCVWEQQFNTSGRLPGVGDHATWSDPMGVGTSVWISYFSCVGFFLFCLILFCFYNRQMISRPRVVACAQTWSSCMFHGCLG